MPQQKSAGRLYTLRPPRSWLGRAALVLAVSAFAALALFFLAVFLVVGAALAGVLVVRWWWLARKATRAQEGAAIEGEYVVVKPEDNVAGARRQPDHPRVLPPEREPQ